MAFAMVYCVMFVQYNIANKKYRQFCWSQTRLAWLLCSLIIPSVSAVDAKPPPNPVKPLVCEPSESADYFDRLHSSCSDCIYGFCSWTDGFVNSQLQFRGDNKPSVSSDVDLLRDVDIDEDVRLSYVRVSPTMRIREGGIVEFDVDFRARLRLPRTQRRVNVFFDRSDAREDLLRDFEGRTTGEELEDSNNRGSAGVQLSLWDRSGLQMTASVGAGFRPDPEPKIKLGLYGRYDVGTWLLKVHQDVIWDSDDGFGKRIKVDTERRFGRDLLVQFGAEGIWSETSHGVDVSQSALLTYFLSKRRSVGLKFGVFEHTHPSTVVDEFRIRAPYQQQLWKAWTFVEIEPGIRFSRERDFRLTPELVITVDLLAGHIPE